MERERATATGETIAPSSKSHVAVTLAVALMVVAGLNVAALFYLRAFPRNRTYWLVEQKWRKLETLSEPVDWVVLGDSSGNQGVRSDVWSATLNGSSANFCTVADMLALGDAWMLERYVERHGPPKGGAVIVHAYDMWHRPVSDGMRGQLLASVPLPWGFWERLTPPVSLGARDMVSLLASKHLPLYSQNTTLANILLGADWLHPPHFQLDASGYMAHLDANPEAVQKDAEVHLEFVRKHTFKPSAPNLAALLRIRELAEKKRFHVYLATSPLFADLTHDLFWRRYFVKVRKLLEQSAAGSPFLHFVLKIPVTFRADELENVDHATHESAAAYTQALANSIKAELASRESLGRRKGAADSALPLVF